MMSARVADEPMKDAAFALLKPRLGLDVAAAIVEHLGCLPFSELRDVTHHGRIVEIQFRIQTAKAVGSRGDRQIVDKRRNSRH